MKKLRLLGLLTLLGVVLTSCGFKNSKEDIVWSKWHDNGDGTHSRHSLKDITIQETDVHHFVLQKTSIEPTDVTPGKALYSCQECGAKEDRVVPPTGNYVFDQKVASPEYLYEKCSEHSSIYYMSSKEGAYGNPDYLFEVSDIGDEYTEVDVAYSDGSQYINTGVKNTTEYVTETNYLSNRNRVPSEYAEVEYIKADANQWINTLYVLKSDVFKVDFKVSLDLNDINRLTLFGSSNANTHSYTLCIWHNDDYGEGIFKHWVGDGGELMPITYQNGVNEATYEVNNGVVSARVNGTSYSSSYPGQAYNDGQFYIFGENYGNDCKERANGYTLYSFKLTEGGKEARNFIPVIRLSDNKPGLYDTVTRAFFTNQGTGEFKYGNIISYENSQRLPSGYTELSYIESDGSQYIDTNVNGNNGNLKIEVTYESSTTNHSDCKPVFIARNDSSSGIAFWTDGHAQFGTPSKTIEGFDAVGKHTVSLGKDGLFYDGNVMNFVPGNQFDSANLILLKEINDGRSYVGKLYSCKVWDNDILIRNLVPAKSSSGVVGMYDLATKEFFENSGTGTFEKGEEIIVNGKVPKEFNELDYIESSGTQYIDTGIVATSHIRIKVTFQYLSVVQEEADIIAADIGSAHPIIGSINGKFRFCPGGDNHIYYETMDTERHSVDMSINSLTFDDKALGNGEAFELSQNYYMFAASDEGGVNFFSSSRIYSCQLYSDDLLVRDFVPALRKSDQCVGMYDLVTKTFFENSGIGEFKKGNVVEHTSQSNSLYTQVEYIKFNGTQFIDTKIKEEATWVFDLKWDTQSGERELIGYSGSESDYFGIQANGNYGIYTPTDVAAGTRDNVIYSYEDGHATIIVNGNIAYNATQDLEPPQSFGIGGLISLTNGDFIFKNYGLTLYSLDCYVSNNLIASFKPCINNQTTKAGLYETLSDEFFEDRFGGSFEVGSLIGDIGNQIAQETEDLSSIEAVALPESYHQLAYINVSGFHTLSTGLIGSMNIDLVAKFKNSHAIQTFGYSVDKPVFAISDNGKYYTSESRVGQKDKISIDVGETEPGKLTAKLNDVAIFENGYDIPGEDDMKLFSTGGIGGVYGKIYSLKITQLGQLKMDLVPAKNIYTNEIGFYDLVSESFLLSSNNIAFTGGNDMALSSIDMTNINMFISRYSNERILQKTDISDFKIYNSKNELIKNFVPVLRNEDGKLGFYEIIEKKFYESPIGNEFSYNIKVGHIFGEEKTLVNPTHFSNGEKECVCKICGRHVHEKIDRTAFKVTFQVPTFVRTIKIFSEVDPSKYEESLVGYTRNIATYNYSKNNAMIYFEVMLTEDTEIVVKSSNGKVVHIDGNKYRVENILGDCTVTIGKK